MRGDGPTTDKVERALLGSLMLIGRAELWGKMSRTVKAADFVRESHRLIFEAIYDVGKEADPDLVLVSARLEDTGKLERAGGAAYLSSVVDDLPCVDNVVEYAKVVRARAVLRKAEARR